MEKKILIFIFCNFSTLIFVDAQAIYLTNGWQSIYAVDISNCQITDSFHIGNDGNFNAIATDSTGDIFGVSRSNSNKDSVFYYNAASGSWNYQCTLPPPSMISQEKYLLCSDHAGHLVTVYNGDATGGGNADFTIRVFDPNTCSVIKQYLVKGFIPDGDIEFVNGNYYLTSDGTLFEVDVTSDTIPIVTRVADNSIPALNGHTPDGINSLFNACYNGKSTFFAAYPLAENLTQLIMYNPATGKNEPFCQLPVQVLDGAFYYSIPNYFFLGRDTSFCKGTSHKLKTNYASTVWSTGQTGPSINAPVPGKYWATVTNSCGTYSDTIVLDTLVDYPLNIGRDTVICNSSGNPSMFSFVSNYQNTWWNLNGTYYSASEIFIFTDHDTTINAYAIKPCFPTDTMFDTVRVRYISDTFSLTLSTNRNKICRGQTAILTSNVSNTVWSTGQTAQQITVSQPGTYKATYVTPCSTKTDSITIFSQDTIPKLYIGRDTIICSGNSVTIVSNVTNTIWSTGVTASSITVSDSGSYWAIASDSCTTYRDTMIVHVQLVDTLKIYNNDTSVCPNSTITLRSNSSLTNWGGTQAQTIDVIIHRDTVVTGTLLNPCNPSSPFVKSISVTVFKEADISIQASSTTICKDSVLLTASPVPYKWILPDLSETTSSSLLARDTGWYTAVAHGTCVDIQDSLKITQYCPEEPIPEDTCLLYLPTAFSPNFDGLNDLFAPFSECDSIISYQLDIFNRWGQLVFETNDLNMGWNGFYKDQLAPIDDYSWIIQIISPNERKQLKGIVTLLR